MWEHRNNTGILHSKGSSIHRHEGELIDQEIRTEWLNCNALPRYYAHLFHGTLTSTLDSLIHQKKRWLINIWAAQEAWSELRADRNEHVVNIFERWKKVNDRDTK